MRILKNIRYFENQSKGEYPISKTWQDLIHQIHHHDWLLTLNLPSIAIFHHGFFESFYRSDSVNHGGQGLQMMKISESIFSEKKFHLMRFYDWDFSWWYFFMESRGHEIFHHEISWEILFFFISLIFIHTWLECLYFSYISFKIFYIGFYIFDFLSLKWPIFRAFFDSEIWFLISNYWRYD